MDWSLRDVARVPGLLSVSRLPLAVAFALTIHQTWWWAELVLVAAGASDVLDGWYARRFDQTTPTGALLDPVMDKIFVSTIVVVLVITDRLSLVEALLLGTRELGVLAIGTFLVLRRSNLQRLHPPRMLGKLTTALQYAAAVAAVARSTDVAVFALAAAITGALATAAYWRHERDENRVRRH